MIQKIRSTHVLTDTLSDCFWQIFEKKILLKTLLKPDIIPNWACIPFLFFEKFSKLMMFQYLLTFCRWKNNGNFKCISRFFIGFFNTISITLQVKMVLLSRARVGNRINAAGGRNRHFIPLHVTTHLTRVFPLSNSNLIMEL